MTIAISVRIAVSCLFLLLGLLSPSRSTDFRLFSFFKVIFITKNLFFEIPEVVVEDKVAVRLFGQEEDLDKLFPWFVVIGHFTNNMNQDPVVCAGMRVDRMNKDFALFELDLQELLMDGSLALQERSFLAFDTMKIVRILDEPPASQS